MTSLCRTAAPRRAPSWQAGLRGAGLALLLAGCSDLTASTPAGEAATAVRAVQVTALRLEPQVDRQSFTGVVRARFELPHGFRVAGKVARRLVDVGDRVRAGDLVAVLDQTDYRLALDAAAADVRAAEAEVAQTSAEEQRQRDLRGRGWSAQAEYDRALSAARAASERLSAAKANRQMAENRLAYTEVRAEADGVVLSVRVEPGQVVAEGAIAATLARAGEREAVVAIPESRLAGLAAAGASARFWALPGLTVPASLREIAPEADAAGRTFSARFTLAGADGIALGQTVTIELIRPVGAPAARVPLSAIWYREGAARVFVADPGTGRLKARSVEVYSLGRDSALIGGDIADGDLVVTLGVHRLDETMAVRIGERRTAEVRP